MPKPSDPYVAAQCPQLQGAAFDPGTSARREVMEAELHWQALVDARLIGAVQPLSPDAVASIDAAERVLGVGRYHGR